MLSPAEATAIREVGGDQRVLKWESDPDNIASRLAAVALTERLRVEAQWPVPRQHAIEEGGWLFVSQDFMPGTTVTRISHGVVDELFALHVLAGPIRSPARGHRSRAVTTRVSPEYGPPRA